MELAGQILQLSKDESGLLGLHHLSLQQLMELRGVGKVKAIQLKCLGELSTRIARTSARKAFLYRSGDNCALLYGAAPASGAGTAGLYVSEHQKSVSG